MEFTKILRAGLLALLLAMPVASLLAQPQPDLPNGVLGDPDFGKHQVWHKNVELICPINYNFRFGAEQFQTLPIYDGTETNFSAVATIREEYDMDNHATNLYDAHIRIDNINNWRNGVPQTLELKVMRTGESRAIEFHQFVVWTDPENNHSYMAASIAGSGDVAGVDDPVIPTVFARILIFDLTEALAFTTSTNNVIIVDDPAVRNSAHLAGETTTTHKVYIGYIEKDVEHFTRIVNNNPRSIAPHTMNLEPNIGLMVLSPLEMSDFTYIDSYSVEQNEKVAFVDVFDMKSIRTHSNYSSTSAFVEPSRFTTEYKGISGLNTPIPIYQEHATEKNEAMARPHETHFKISDDKIILFISSLNYNYQRKDYLEQVDGGVYKVLLNIDRNNPSGSKVATQNFYPFSDIRNIDLEEFETKSINKLYENAFKSQIYRSSRASIEFYNRQQIYNEFEK